MDKQNLDQPEVDNKVQANSQINAVDDLLNTENLIKNYLGKISQLKEQLQKEKEMFESVFDNDEIYQKHSVSAKEATNVRNTTKKELMKQPSMINLATKIKEMRLEMKEMQAALSEYLQKFRQMSGLSQIETDNGEVMEIVFSAKLVKRSAFKK